ncbi:unnamed protein product [Pleuronectes platessa]|uniref:Uncharacterized protein n=1 Tax=Pleuronectes platessa TaxID=8262 RepID=A0A9N7VN26_PLEPL|nr:unnamed protein product [Pleuronectes platessa]
MSLFLPRSPHFSITSFTDLQLPSSHARSPARSPARPVMRPHWELGLRGPPARLVPLLTGQSSGLARSKPPPPLYPRPMRALVSPEKRWAQWHAAEPRPFLFKQPGSHVGPGRLRLAEPRHPELDHQFRGPD